MDWSSIGSMRSGYRNEIVLLVGVLLLANPVLVGVTDFGDPDRYQYRATKVAGLNGTIDVPPGVDVNEPLVLCLDPPVRRSCMLERAIAERGGIVYDGVPQSHLAGDYLYVFDVVDGEDRFYRPTTSRTATGEIRYSRERVSSRDALQHVSTPLRQASPGVRNAIRTGSYVSSDELPGTGSLVQTDQGYYVVDVAEGHETEGERRVVVRALQWIGGGIGIVLIYRAGVRKGRRRRG